MGGRTGRKAALTEVSLFVRIMPGSQPPPATVQREQVERRWRAGMTIMSGAHPSGGALRVIAARLGQRAADRDGATAPDRDAVLTFRESIVGLAR